MKSKWVLAAFDTGKDPTFACKGDCERCPFAKECYARAKKEEIERLAA